MVLVLKTPQPGWPTHQIWYQLRPDQFQILAAWQFPSLGKILLAHYTKYVFSSLWPTLQISQYLPQCASKPIPEPHNQLPGAQKKLFQVIKALTFTNNSCKTWRDNPAPTEPGMLSILSSIIRCFVKATETHHRHQQEEAPHQSAPWWNLLSIRPQLLIPNWSSHCLQENHLSKVHREGCTCRTGTWSRCPPGPLTHKVQIIRTRSLQDDYWHEKVLSWLHQAERETFCCFRGRRPNILKTIQPPFCYWQADIFGPILAHQNVVQLKRWVHLEILHNYSSQSITRGFRRTFSLRGTPCIISRLDIVKAGKDLINTEMRVISSLYIKFESIEFRVNLPKHQAWDGAVERNIGSINKLNNQPLILGALFRITLQPCTSGVPGIQNFIDLLDRSSKKGVMVDKFKINIKFILIWHDWSNIICAP